jgi:nucleoside-diphosphate-sugar epimerase
MKVLFIGGTGTISEACSSLAAQKGIELYLLNRGITPVAVPEGVRTLVCDIRDRAAAVKILDGKTFDVVVNWIAYTPEHIETDLALFRGKTGQYIFISSASVYQKPPDSYIITESTPLLNPFWEYSRDKIACENRLMQAYREEGFPVTIVRPSHTYGSRLIPGAVMKRYLVVDRMKKGQKIIVQGDGQSLWVMTHCRDFAVGFTGLLGNSRAIGESFHITSDEALTWDQITQAIGAAVGLKPDIIHIPSELINAYEPEIGAGLLGDKAYSTVFDNSKIKRLVPEFKAVIPFAAGIRETVAWFEADPRRCVVDENLNRRMNRVIAGFERAYPV